MDTVKFYINKKGQKDGLLVIDNGHEYHIVYSADFDISKEVMPYGIFMPNEDIVTLLNDKKAKSIWRKLKPQIKAWINE